jgi:peptidyl-tRNA hydrolase, PTH2 family
MNENIKQVIVVRKDLNMRKGKIAAQAAHGSMKVFFDRKTSVENGIMQIDITPEMELWINGLFTKICVSVNSEAELESIYQSALDAGLPTALIVDAGLTEFNGVPTKTVVAIGPTNAEAINKITGHLPLL